MNSFEQFIVTIFILNVKKKKQCKIEQEREEKNESFRFMSRAKKGL